MKISQLERQFKIGVAVLADPAPGQPLDVVQELLSATYPQVRWTHLYESDAVLIGDKLQYEILVPPPKVNG